MRRRSTSPLPAALAHGAVSRRASLARPRGTLRVVTASMLASSIGAARAWASAIRPTPPADCLSMAAELLSPRSYRASGDSAPASPSAATVAWCRSTPTTAQPVDHVASRARRGSPSVVQHLQRRARPRSVERRPMRLELLPSASLRVNSRDANRTSVLSKEGAKSLESRSAASSSRPLERACEVLRSAQSPRSGPSSSSSAAGRGEARDTSRLLLEGTPRDRLSMSAAGSRR